jgi:hypothetical protein
MPSIMEISGTGDGGIMDLKQALAAVTVAKMRRRMAKKAKKSRKARKAMKVAHKGRGRMRAVVPGGMNASKAIELAERFFREGRKPLSIMWARRAENLAKSEAGGSAIARRANEIIKAVRGEAALKALAAFGDVSAIANGRLLGLW